MVTTDGRLETAVGKNGGKMGCADPFFTKSWHGNGSRFQLFGDQDCSMKKKKKMKIGVTEIELLHHERRGKLTMLEDLAGSASPLQFQTDETRHDLKSVSK
jgi:hypothetical protein